MKYQAIPYRPWPVAKIKHIVRETARRETMFSDFQRACDDLCMECPLCMQRMATILWRLNAVDSAVWEVWNVSDSDTPCGILYLTDIVAGTDAVAHFNFFDGELRDKRAIIESVLREQVFGRLGLHRVSTEVPAHMHSLAKFVSRKLSFREEGVRREAMLWRGDWQDVRLFGRIREDESE